MLKTLKTLFKQDKEKFVVPKSVQAIIPIKTIWEDGVMLSKIMPRHFSCRQ